MALSVSIAVATAQAPAARSPRAAATATTDSPEGFAALLARTADDPVATRGEPRLDGEGVSDVDEAPEVDETADLTAMPGCIEPCLWFVTPVADSEILEPVEPTVVDAIAVAGESAEEDKGVKIGAGERPAPVSAPATSVSVSAQASGASAIGLAQPVGGNREPVNREVVEGAPSATAPRTDERSPAIEAPSGKAARTATAEAAALQSEGRAEAQAILAKALASTGSIAPVPAVADQTRVATTPILAGPAPQAPTDPAGPPARTRAVQAPVAVLPGETRESVTPTFEHTQTGEREAGQQQPQDRGQPAGRTFGLTNAAGLPASMVFPGQATFATAMERALPLAQSLPPAFSSQALDTVVPQIVRSLHMQVTTGGGDMRLTLTPEHLGTVTIELRVEHQRVTATLAADTPAVRGWIAAHEQDLKAGLADLGLQLDEFVVRDDDPRDRRDPNARHQTLSRRKRARSEDSVFEVEA